MPEATIDKAVCAECGVDVRENTVFCYNCGSPVAELPAETISDSNGAVSEVDDETQAALDELAEKLKFDEEADNKLAKAAAERKKARSSQRRSNEFTWEPAVGSSGSLIILIAILVTALAVGIVFLTVLWR